MTSEIKLKRDVAERSRHLKAQRTSTIRHEATAPQDDDHPDLWLSGEPGAEHRYARHPRTLTPAQAYQQGAALKTQVSTHRPFYFEDIGREPAPPPRAEVQRAEARAPQIMSYQVPTRFYPPRGDDSITPIGRVQPAQLQRVLPSYELSTEETRETGLGPALERRSYLRRSSSR